MTRDTGVPDEQGVGVPSSGSDHSRAEPEGVSALRASVPNAEIVPALPWRSMETAPHDGTIFAVWCRAWNRSDGEPRIQFAQWLDPFLTGGKLCAPWDWNNNPYANGWLSLEELSVVTASGTPTRRAETIGSVGEADGGPVAKPDAKDQPHD